MPCGSPRLTISMSDRELNRLHFQPFRSRSEERYVPVWWCSAIHRTGESFNRGKPEGPPWPSNPPVVPFPSRRPFRQPAASRLLPSRTPSQRWRTGAFRAVSTVRSGPLKSHVVSDPLPLNEAPHSDTSRCRVCHDRSRDTEVSRSNRRPLSAFYSRVPGDPPCFHTANRSVSIGTVAPSYAPWSR